MKYSFLIIVVSVLLNSSITYSQDIHFSQFKNASQLINPALTGKSITQYIDESYFSFGTNFKNQGSSISVPYRTYSAFFDGSVSPRKMKRSLIGFGLVLYNDMAGDASLQNSSGMISLSFTRGFNRFNTFTASLGFSLGFINRSVDITNLVFDNQWNGVIFDPSQSSSENFASNSVFALNFNFGGLVKYKFNNYFYSQIGASLSHINKPKISFYDNDNKINEKLIVHANALIVLDKYIYMEPGIMYSLQSNTYEFIVGSNVNIAKKDLQLILGMWYRINRDIIPLIGIKYSGYQISMSYDVNVSRLNSATHYLGGVEISLIKVFNKRSRGLECSEYQ